MLKPSPPRPAPPPVATIEQAARTLSPPVVLIEALIAELEQPHLNLALVGPTIARCPELTLHVLREANAPGWIEKTMRPADAATRLGRERLAELCTTLLAGAQEPYPLPELFAQANQIARSSAYLAKLRFAYDAQHAAHVAGLLSLIGVRVLVRLGCDLAGRPEDPAVAAEWERQRFGVDHARIGEQLARSWFFPHPLCEAIADVAAEAAPRDELSRAVWLAARLNGSAAEAVVAARACGFSAKEAELLLFQHLIGPTKVPLFSDLRRPCPLTETQLAYMRLLAAGTPRSEISRRHGRALNTVNNVLCAAFKRLGVNGQHNALLLCRDQGWL